MLATFWITFCPSLYMTASRTVLAKLPNRYSIINDPMTSYEHLLPPGGATADRDV